jgi:predicted TIM-barrel fold metal-dependent hydrolase
MHVFGPFDRFPLAAERAYNVAEAPLEAHERIKAGLGIERTVLVQASGYGFDNRAMLAPETPAGELEKLHAAGVRGLRLNLITLPSRHAGDPAALIGAYERLLAPLGWHLQIFAGAETFASFEPVLARCAVNLVIDHMGLPDSTAGTAQPGFQAVLRLVEKKHVWVKLAGRAKPSSASGRHTPPRASSTAVAAPRPCCGSSPARATSGPAACATICPGSSARAP